MHDLARLLAINVERRFLLSVRRSICHFACKENFTNQPRTITNKATCSTACAFHTLHLEMNPNTMNGPHRLCAEMDSANYS
jgi:hypothetical protein